MKELNWAEQKMKTMRSAGAWIVVYDNQLGSWITAVYVSRRFLH